MFNKSSIVIYRARSSIHCGADEADAAIDQPVVRESHTGFPTLPGPTLKGRWRALCRDDKPNWKEADTLAAFGPEPNDADGEKAKGSDYSGALGMPDARLLFLPVRAEFGTFLMVTCPLQLELYAENLDLCGISHEIPSSVEPEPFRNSIIPLEVDGAKEHVLYKGKLYMEDLEFEIAQRRQLRIPLPTDYPCRLRKRLVMVSDEIFQWICRHCLPIAARNSLDHKTKTSKNLWYEELVPTESTFWALVLQGPNRTASETQDYLEKLAGTSTPYFQVGGHATVGRGQCSVSFNPRCDEPKGGRA